MMTETLAQIHYHKYGNGSKQRQRQNSDSSTKQHQQKQTDEQNSKDQQSSSSTSSINTRTRSVSPFNNRSYKSSENGTIMKVSSAVNMMTMLQQDSGGEYGGYSEVSGFRALNRPKQIKRGTSFVVGQKLRESKWFDETEESIFCAVVETGFIVEQKEDELKNKTENDLPNTQYGVVVWKLGYEKSKNPDYLSIYTLRQLKGKMRVVDCSLDEFWPKGTKLRINNKSDKTEKPLDEATIRNQVTYSLSTRRKWHNSEHYAYYCRYGPAETHFRVKKITDHFRWNTETFFTKIRSLSTKQ